MFGEGGVVYLRRRELKVERRGYRSYIFLVFISLVSFKFCSV